MSADCIGTGCKAEALLEHIKELEATLDRLYRIAHCGSVDSFLACNDEVKRGYFAMMIEESVDNKKLRERVAELEEENSKMTRIMMMTGG